MDRDILVKKAIGNFAKLSDRQLQEVADFADFLLSKAQDQLLIEDIQQITREASAFNFLNEEPELYSVNDLKKVYK